MNRQHHVTHALFPGITLTLILLLGITVAPPAGAEGIAGDKADVSMTRAQGDAILRELKLIRGLLVRFQRENAQAQAQGSRQPPAGPAPTLRVALGDKPALGAADAPVTVVEFTDFECPYCKRFLDTTYPGLKQEFIDSGRVRWVVSDLPLGFHKNARKAAQAAHCAGEQDKYWELRDILFANHKQLAEPQLPGYAQQAELDLAAFNACLASERHLAAIDTDIQQAQAMRITGTPTFVVAPSTKDKIIGKTIVGAQPIGVFQTTIRGFLETARRK